MTDAETDRLVAQYDQVRAQIPEPILALLKGTKDQFPGIDPSRVKAMFASKLALPAVAAQPAPKKFEVAWRATISELKGLLASQNFDFDFQPISIGGNPMQAKVDDKNPGKARDWRLRMFGLARCTDPRSSFEGPAGIMIFNFASESAAKAESDRFVPGKLYRLRARLSDKSPKGTMAMGQIGIINGTASEPTREIPQPNGGSWPNAFQRVAEIVPLSPMADLLRSPKEYVFYRIEAEVIGGRTGTSQSGMFGSLAVSDPSVTGELMQMAKGGIPLFLSKFDISKAKLAVGSKVAAIVSCYKTRKKDQQGNKTGDEVWNWNAIAIEVLEDLSAGTELPDPSKKTLDIPAGTPGVSREVF